MDNSSSTATSSGAQDLVSGLADEDGNFIRNVSEIMIINGGKDLFINEISYSDAGFYFCRVSSSSGVVDSRLATVTGTH